MNAKLVAFSLMLMVLFMAGCTSIMQDNQQPGIDSTNQTIDELVDDYSDDITDVDLGEMI